MLRRILLLLVILALSLAILPAAAQEDTLPDVTLFLGFIPNIQFAPVYVAIERGYFAEEAGVNVVLEYGDENLGVERLAANDLQFAMISGEQVVLARYGGRPLVYVFEWFQRFPVGIVAPADSGIATPQDLAGRTVGLPGRFGASYIGLRALLAASGLSEDALNLQEIGFNAPAVLCAGGVEAAVVYIANEPVQIAEQCTPVTVIEIASLADLVANGLVTNEQTIAEHPDLVRGMVRAFARGLADVIANPDDAFRLSRPHIETLPAPGGARVDVSIAATDALRLLEAVAAGETPDPAALESAMAALADLLHNDEVIQMRVLRNSIALWEAPHLGETDPQSWETTMNALVEMGLLPEAYDLSGAYSNDFLPQ